MTIYDNLWLIDRSIESSSPFFVVGIPHHNRRIFLAIVDSDIVLGLLEIVLNLEVKLVQSVMPLPQFLIQLAVELLVHKVFFVLFSVHIGGTNCGFKVDSILKYCYGFSMLYLLANIDSDGVWDSRS